MIKEKILVIFCYLLTEIFKPIKNQHGFARVVGPLMSYEARGKIADMVVFFPWKGRNVVRQWLKPTNPHDPDQMRCRAICKGIGKAIKFIMTKDDVTNGSIVYQRALASTPSGQIWNAWVGKNIMSVITTLALWTTFTAKWSTATAYTSFNTLATTLGLADFSFTTGYTETVAAGLQLFMAAEAAYQMNMSEYNTDPEDWAVTLATAFADDFTTAV